MEKKIGVSIFIIIIQFPIFNSNGQSKYGDCELSRELLNPQQTIKQLLADDLNHKQPDGHKIFNSEFHYITEVINTPYVNLAGSNAIIADENSKKSGYINITEINYGTVIGDPEHLYSYGIEIINGYMFNQFLSAGIGLGLDRLIFAVNAKHTMPSISLDLRLYVFKNQILFLSDHYATYFVACNIGYIYNLTGHQESYSENFWGKFICPSIGYNFSVFSDKAISLRIGLKFQENTINYLDMYIPKTLKLLNIKAGFVF